MASAHLTIAKASFSASLLRPDVTKVNRDDLPAFHASFEEAVVKCSPRNIQNCKPFLLEHVLPSEQRTAAFGKYLTSFSKHLSISPNDQENPTCVQRRRLHVLYILNDLLHHTKYHVHRPPSFDHISKALRPMLVGLFQLASDQGRRRVKTRLRRLVQIWKAEGYLTSELDAQIRECLDDAHIADNGPVATESITATKELPYILPASHGDPSIPFYDLPAGNLMPHIMPNSSEPMQGHQVRALQFSAGTADEGLVNALKDFLEDVETIDKAFLKLDGEGTQAEIDDMGQISYHDETGDLIGDTYYGWSRAFCEKMKRRRQTHHHDSADRPSRSRSVDSRSSSRSRSLPKRRRYDSTESRSSSYSRSKNDGDVAARDDRQPSNPTLLTSAQPRFLHSESDDRPRIDPNSTNFHTGPSPFAHGPPLIPPPFIGQNGAALPPRPPNWDSSIPWPPPPPPVLMHGAASAPFLGFVPPPPPYHGRMDHRNNHR